MPIKFLHEGFDALVGARRTEDLLAATRRLTQQLGFEHFAYALQIDLPLNRPTQFIFSGFPAEWVQRYRDNNYFACDPVLRETASGLLPVIWQQRHFADPKAQTFWEEARSFGVAQGISVSVRERPGMTAIFSLARDRELDQRGRDLAALIGDTQLFASLVHTAITRLKLPELLPESLVQLTARERECLRWASDGKTAWEIGQILNITERTAVFHIDNCIQKLGACNKVHAVTRAITLGLLRSI